MLRKVRILLAIVVAVVGMIGTMAPSGVSAQSVQNPISVPGGATIDDLISVGASFALNDGNECAAGTPRVVMGVDGEWIWGYFGSTPATINDCSLAGANLIGAGMWESPRTGANNYTSFSAVLAEYSGSPITALLIIDENEIIEDLVPFAEWVAPPAAASVTGQVFEDGTGTPLVGATVCINETDQCTTSGDGGYYAIGGVFNNDYLVTASLDGYVSQTLAHTVAGVNGGPTFYLAPALPDAASVAGQVFEDGTGTPLVGATVCIDGTELCTTSVDGGYYAIGGVFNGDYFVTASLEGYGSQTLAHTVAGVDGGPTFYLAPIPTSLVTVTVLDEVGDPLPDADVAVYSEFFSDPIAVGVTNADGQFEFGRVQYYTYTVQAVAEGYDLRQGDYVADAPESFWQIQLTRSEGLPNAASVAGQVFEDQTGVPLVGATVCIDETDQCTTSVAGGYYSIGGVFNDDYLVTASMPGYGSQTLAHTVAGVTDGPDFFLAPLPDEVVTMNIWKFVCSGFSEAQEDGCVENDALNSTDVDFTVSYTVGDDVTTVETSLEIEGSEGSAVLTLPLADSFTVCEIVPEGVSEVVFNVAGIDDVDVDDDGCVTFSGEGISDGDELNIAFWNIVPTDGSETPEQPVVPVKPGTDDPKPAAVTSLPETGSGAASTVATAPIMLIAAAAAAAGVGAILRKDR